MGKALRDGYRERVFLMTKIDGRTKTEAARAARRVAAPPPGRPRRPRPAPRGDPLRGPAPHLPRRRRQRGARRGPRSRQAALHRLHGPQGPARPPRHARGRRRPRFRLRRRADAAQPARRPLPQLRAPGAPASRRARHRRARHEEHGRGLPAQDGRGDADRVPALRARPADVGRRHRHRQPRDPRSGAGGGAHLPPAHRRAARRRCWRRRPPAAADGRFEPFKTTSLFDGTAEHPEWLGEEPEPSESRGGARRRCRLATPRASLQPWPAWGPRLSSEEWRPDLEGA